MPGDLAQNRADQTRTLDEPVSMLPSVGGKRLTGLKRLGISTIRDLLTNYPFRYNDLSKIVPIAQASLVERASIMGTIKDVTIKQPRPRLMIIEASIIDGSGLLIATWFNQPWLQKTLTAGTRLILMGKVEHSYGFKRMSSPLHFILDEEVKTGSIIPVYRSNSDISQGWVSHCVDDALALLPALIDPLPARVRIAHGFVSRQVAFASIHHPPDDKARLAAHRRLAFEEVFLLQLCFQLRKRRLRENATPHTHSVHGPALAGLLQALPFTLTDDQKRSVDEILTDMASEEIMSRLLMGDVGSGKTVVAALALSAVHDSGYQAAMMAPTEVLAEQYALKIGPLFDEVKIPWALLTSSTKEGQRRELLAGLAQGSISVLFGTHALIEPDVCFKDLSLVIIDEQHRFGVEQREKLRRKGEGCDLLSMTATPIPRTLALTIYGDMDTSYIRTKPQHTVTTTTKVIHWNDIAYAYEAIRSAISRGEQAYIVCPLISASASGTDVRLDGQGRQPDEQKNEQGLWQEEGFQEEIWITEFTQDLDEGHIQAAEQEVEFLQAKIFPENRLALMTSRLKSSEKQRVMDMFRNGCIDILVSTTVIEVGVDVPNATVMVIEDADHFGLSQLHQLRGRVGRGSSNGEVFLVTRTRNEDSIKRLAVMEKCSDGFELAEHDLSLRREGEILGSRQHGTETLKLVNVIRDAELIKTAHEEALKLLREDPLLASPENRLLLPEIGRLFGTELQGT